MVKISVALCTYNGSNFILEQLNSIVNQSRIPDEIVICDDCSTDDTVLKVTNYIRNLKGIDIKLFVNEMQLGYVKNFEKAIKQCSGDIILLSDQDDVWLRNKIEVIENIFLTNPDVSMVFSNAEIVDHNLKSKGYDLFKSVGLNYYKKRLIKNGKLFDVLIKYNVVTGATMAFKKELVNAVTPFSNLWVHDAWIAIIISSFAKVHIIETPLIKYRQHSNNMIGASYKIIEQYKKVKKKGYDMDIGYMQMRELVDFVTSKSIIPQGHRKKLIRKAKHFYKRSMFPKNFFKRLLLILLEFVTLKYYLYSNGYKSALKDIFLYKK